MFSSIYWLLEREQVYQDIELWVATLWNVGTNIALNSKNSNLCPALTIFFIS